MKDTGRPPKFSSVVDLEEGIDLYFKDCEHRKKPATIAGLAYYLGFETRQSIYDYAKRKRFSYAIKRAQLRIEQEMTERVQTTSGNVAGTIFVLKSCHGYREADEVTDRPVIGKVNVTVKQ
jgi:hypothetical protein